MKDTTKMYIFFVITLCMLILNSFVIGVKAPETDYIYLIENAKDYEKYGFKDLGIYYTPEGLTSFDMPLVIEKRDTLTSVKSADLKHNFVGSKGSFNERFRSIDYKIIAENDKYYIVNYHMECKASDKTFSIDVIPEIKGIKVNKFAWWNSNWKNFITCTINQFWIDNNLVNFTTLVTINSTIGSLCNSNKSIRFIGTDNITVYAFDIERFTASSNSYIWVRIPYVYASVNTTFLMYFNNSLCATGENKTGTWKNYIGVYHMNDKNSTSSVLDSSVNWYTGSKKGANEPINATGKIQYAQDFDGTNDYIQSSGSLYDITTNSMTMEAWIKADVTLGTFRIINKPKSGSGGTIKYTLVVDAERIQALIDANALCTNEIAFGANNIGVWNHIFINYDGTNMKLYRNGILRDTDALAGNIDATVDGNFRIGSFSSTYPQPFNGVIDEVRVTALNRNASWIKANFYTVNASNFTKYGGSIAYGGLPTVYYESIVSMYYPTNNSNFSCPCCIALGIAISDNDSSNMNITFYSNYTGTWNNVFSFNNVVNGTYYVSLTNFSIYDFTYYWNVSFDDGVNYNKSGWFILKTDNFTNCNSSLSGSSFFTSGMGTLSFDETQFYLLLMFSLWVFLLLGSEKKPILALLQLLVGIPLGSLCLTIAYFGTISYGYLIGIVIICVSGLVAFLELKR